MRSRTAVTAVTALALIALLVVAGTSASGKPSSSPTEPSVQTQAPTASTSPPIKGRVVVTIPTWENFYPGQFDPWLLPTHNRYGWHFTKNTNTPNLYGTDFGLNNTSGITLWLTGSHDERYAPGYVEATYTAPGTTRISSISLVNTFKPRVYRADHCTEIGLRVNEESRDSVTDCNPPEAVDVGDGFYQRSVNLQDPAPNPTARQAFFRLEFPPCKDPASPSCPKNIPPKDQTNGWTTRMDSVEMVLVDDDNPVVTPSGELFGLADSYIAGNASYELIVDADDAGAGIREIAVDHQGNALGDGALGQIAFHASPCDLTHRTESLDNRICPRADRTSATIDTTTMPEGTNTIEPWAKDPAENRGARPFKVKIDKTPPPPPPNIRFLTPDEGSGQVQWDESVDPPLIDGTPGSGTTTYRFRSRVNGGEWNAWKTIDAPRQISDENYDHPIGTRVDFEVVAVDKVGNVSGVSGAGGVVMGELPEAALTGPLADIDYDYTNGQQAYDLTVTGTDTGSGVKHVGLVRDGTDVIASANSSCIPASQPFAPGKTSCPSSFAATFNVATQGLAEGAHGFRANVTDRANNVGYDDLVVFVDRTGPGIATGFDLGFDDSTGVAEITWDEGIDPYLASGFVQGSGIGRTEVRVNGGPWVENDDESISLPFASMGQVVTVEVRSFDMVGNVSAIASEAITIEDVDPPTTGYLHVHAHGSEGAKADSTMTSNFDSMAGVLVTARHSQTSAHPHRRLTNTDGEAILPLPDGTYTLKATRIKGVDPMPLSQSSVTVENGVHYNLKIGYPWATDTRDCASGGPGTRCGRFLKAKAVAYAKTFAIDDNPSYNSSLTTGGTDCTNFMSQILRAGGMTYAMEFDPRSGSEEANQDQSWWHLKRGLWSGGADSTAHHPPLSYYDQPPQATTSWVRAQGLVNHLYRRGLAWHMGGPSQGDIPASPNGALPKRKLLRFRPLVGDLVFLEYDGNTLILDHAMFVTGKTSTGEPTFSYHTGNTKDNPWSKIVRQYGLHSYGGPGGTPGGWTFQWYRIAYTRFND